METHEHYYKDGKRIRSYEEARLIMLDEMQECRECGATFDPYELDTDIEDTCADCLQRMHEEGQAIAETERSFYGGGRR